MATVGKYDARALLLGERPGYRRCRSQIYADEGGGLCPPRVIVHDYLYIITNKDTIHGRCAHRSARCFQVSAPAIADADRRSMRLIAATCVRRV